MKGRGAVARRVAFALVLGFVPLHVVHETVLALVPSIDTAALATAAAVRTDAPGRTFSVLATGDVLTENAVLETARASAPAGVRYDFTSLFAPIRPMIASADLAICHMEIPIGAAGARAGIYGRSPYGGNLLLAPSEVAGGLRDAGFDRCSTASNHSNDLGVAGIDSTLAQLDAVGLGHAGTARTPDESIGRPFDVNGVSVAHLSVTRYSNTARPVGEWRMDYALDSRTTVDDIRSVRQAGAEVVILSVHVSQELLREPTVADRRFVEEVIAAGGVDLVVVHGPHVVQPVERVGGTWVFWSVGNLLSGMGQPGATRYGPPTLDGLAAWARFTETPAGTFAVDVTAVLVCSEVVARVVHPAVAASTDPNVPAAIRAEMQACIDRSRPLVPALR